MIGRNCGMRSDEPPSRMLSEPWWTHEDTYGRHWESEEYYGTVRREGRMRVLSISSVDETSRHDWREFQQLKNMLVGKEWEAAELYPAESDLKDPSNRFYLWCFRKGTFNFGLPPGRQVLPPSRAIAPQREFPNGNPEPEHGPIVPSAMIDPEVMAEYRRSVEQFEARKDIPR